jgi:hypothetical protein
MSEGDITRLNRMYKCDDKKLKLKEKQHEVEIPLMEISDVTHSDDSIDDGCDNDKNRSRSRNNKSKSELSYADEINDTSTSTNDDDDETLIVQLHFP